MVVLTVRHFLSCVHSIISIGSNMLFKKSTRYQFSPSCKANFFYQHVFVHVIEIHFICSFYELNEHHPTLHEAC